MDEKGSCGADWPAGRAWASGRAGPPGGGRRKRPSRRPGFAGTCGSRRVWPSWPGWRCRRDRPSGCDGDGGLDGCRFGRLAGRRWERGQRRGLRTFHSYMSRRPPKTRRWRRDHQPGQQRARRCVDLCPRRNLRNANRLDGDRGADSHKRLERATPKHRRPCSLRCLTEESRARPSLGGRRGSCAARHMAWIQARLTSLGAEGALLPAAVW